MEASPRQEPRGWGIAEQARLLRLIGVPSHVEVRGQLREAPIRYLILPIMYGWAQRGSGNATRVPLGQRAFGVTPWLRQANPDLSPVELVETHQINGEIGPFDCWIVEAAFQPGQRHWVAAVKLWLHCMQELRHWNLSTLEAFMADGRQQAIIGLGRVALRDVTGERSYEDARKVLADLRSVHFQQFIPGRRKDRPEEDLRWRTHSLLSSTAEHVSNMVPLSGPPDQVIRIGYQRFVSPGQQNTDILLGKSMIPWAWSMTKCLASKGLTPLDVLKEVNKRNSSLMLQQAALWDAFAQDDWMVEQLVAHRGPEGRLWLADVWGTYNATKNRTLEAYTKALNALKRAEVESGSPELAVERKAARKAVKQTSPNQAQLFDPDEEGTAPESEDLELESENGIHLTFADDEKNGLILPRSRKTALESEDNIQTLVPSAEIAGDALPRSRKGIEAGDHTALESENPALESEKFTSESENRESESENQFCKDSKNSNSDSAAVLHLSPSSHPTRIGSERDATESDIQDPTRSDSMAVKSSGEMQGLFQQDEGVLRSRTKGLTPDDLLELLSKKVLGSWEDGTDWEREQALHGLTRVTQEGRAITQLQALNLVKTGVFTPRGVWLASQVLQRVDPRDLSLLCKFARFRAEKWITGNFLTERGERRDPFVDQLTGMAQTFADLGWFDRPEVGKGSWRNATQSDLMLRKELDRQGVRLMPPDPANQPKTESMEEIPENYSVVTRLLPTQTLNEILLDSPELFAFLREKLQDWHRAHEEAKAAWRNPGEGKDASQRASDLASQISAKLRDFGPFDLKTGQRVFDLDTPKIRLMVMEELETVASESER